MLSLTTQTIQDHKLHLDFKGGQCHQTNWQLVSDPR